MTLQIDSIQSVYVFFLNNEQLKNTTDIPLQWIDVQNPNILTTFYYHLVVLTTNFCIVIQYMFYGGKDF